MGLNESDIAGFDDEEMGDDLNLDKMTYDAFVKVLDESCYSRDILNTLSDIEYQINSQKQNNAAFNLDYDDLLLKGLLIIYEKNIYTY